MTTPSTRHRLAALVATCALAGCGGADTANSPHEQGTAAATAAAAAAFPASLNAFGDGYPTAGAPCRRVGETDVTSDLLDDSADLVACPTRTDAQALHGKVVGLVDGFTLVSVPMGNSNAGLANGGAAPAPPAKTASSAGRDVIRGPNGLEAKCLKAMAAQGLKVLGTNHIEESEAAIGIYVNVVGGEAPWRCLGYRDGTIGDVMYTGDEGAA